MKPTPEALERARDELLERVADRPKARLLEPLGRTHRLLGEEDEAVRRFREAAADVESVLERRGEDNYRMALAASLHHMAGDADAARTWTDRALSAGQPAGTAAALRYLAGDFGGAADDAQRAAQDPNDAPYPWAEAVAAVAAARRDGDPEGAARARETFAGLLERDGTPPWEESGSAGLSLSDWVAEATRAEAELRA